MLYDKCIALQLSLFNFKTPEACRNNMQFFLGAWPPRALSGPSHVRVINVMARRAGQLVENPEFATR